MPILEQQSVLTGLQVRDAMRRNVHFLAADAPIADCIRRMIKYKRNALLVVESAGKPAGVVSKTDLMGAYYADLPLETALGDVMAGPPRFCFPDDGLEEALDLMQQNGIHRLYVLGAEPGEIAGVLSFADIVGLLYRYCRFCTKSLRKTQKPGAAMPRLAVREVMSPLAASCNAQDPVEMVVEILSSHRLGAVLVESGQCDPVGVISKTDLMVAYLHGVSTGTLAEKIMTSPVAACSAEALLSEAIQQMLLKDVQRLFITAPDAAAVIGVLSLSDAARFRSGTCRACVASRILAGI